MDYQYPSISLLKDGNNNALCPFIRIITRFKKSINKRNKEGYNTITRINKEIRYNIINPTAFVTYQILNSANNFSYIKRFIKLLYQYVNIFINIIVILIKIVIIICRIWRKMFNKVISSKIWRIGIPKLF